MTDKVTATVNEDLAGIERNRALARWEREGKVATNTIIKHGAGGREQPAQKTRVVEVWRTLHKDEHCMTQQIERFAYDGRLPYPDETTFARISLAVMALA